MNDLKDFFKKSNRRLKRGPSKVACTTKGPAVTTVTYYIQRTIPLTIIAGSPYNTAGPAVNTCGKPTNDNSDS